MHYTAPPPSLAPFPIKILRMAIVWLYAHQDFTAYGDRLAPFSILIAEPSVFITSLFEASSMMSTPGVFGPSSLLILIWRRSAKSPSPYPYNTGSKTGGAVKGLLTHAVSPSIFPEFTNCRINMISLDEIVSNETHPIYCTSLFIMSRRTEIACKR